MGWCCDYCGSSHAYHAQGMRPQCLDCPGDSWPPSRKEIEAAQRQAEELQRQREERAVMGEGWRRAYEDMRTQ